MKEVSTARIRKKGVMDEAGVVGIDSLREKEEELIQWRWDVRRGQLGPAEGWSSVRAWSSPGRTGEKLR